MKIITYINDPYSVSKALEHLADLFRDKHTILQQQTSSDNILTLSFGELDIKGNFFELKFPKSLKKQFNKDKKLTSELLFFEVLSQQNCFDSLLLKLTEAITDFNRKHAFLWSDSSTFLGTNILIPMVLKDKKHISALIHFLNSTNPASEASLSSDLNRIFERHPWCPETLDLLAARSSLIKGRCGHQQLENLLDTPKLKGYLREEKHQNLLLEKLTEYALLDYSEQQGSTPPRDIIENAVHPFRTISEKLSIKSDFLVQSFVEHFPHFLPLKQSLSKYYSR
jgi:hypothetical protein